MGCDGCELWPSPYAIVTKMHGVVQACACASSGQTLTMVQAAIGTRSTSEIYRDRKQLAATICAKACIVSTASERDALVLDFRLGV